MKKNKKKKKPIKTIRRKKIVKEIKGNRIVIHEPMRVLKKNKPEREFNSDKSVRFEINGVLYRVRVNEENKCLEIDTMLSECHCYIQPVSTRCFLVKATKYKEEEK